MCRFGSHPLPQSAMMRSELSWRGGENLLTEQSYAIALRYSDGDIDFQRVNAVERELALARPTW